MSVTVFFCFCFVVEPQGGFSLGRSLRVWSSKYRELRAVQSKLWKAKTNYWISKEKREKKDKISMHTKMLLLTISKKEKKGAHTHACMHAHTHTLTHRLLLLKKQKAEISCNSTAEVLSKLEKYTFSYPWSWNAIMSWKNMEMFCLKKNHLKSKIFLLNVTETE